MQIIAIMNLKGGIGKTTTAAALAYIIAQEHGRRVLAVDADQQGNLSMLFRRFSPEGVGMSELLEKHVTAGGPYRTTDLIQWTPYSNIDIIPANGYLMQTNMKLLMQERVNQISRFAAAMVEISGAYDYCFVDCGLLMDMTVTNVLAAADLVIFPVKIGGFEIAAVDNMEEQLEDLRGLNPNVKGKALMTMLQRNKTSLKVADWLFQDSGHDVFYRAVRRSIIAEKATMERVPLPVFSKRAAITDDYRAVAAEILDQEQAPERAGKE